MIKGPREVEFDKIQGRPIFKDTMTPTGQSICKHCGKYVDTRHPDPCLQKLPGVRYACCGHGNRWQSYIVFENGLTIRGFLSEEDWERDIIKMFKYRNYMHKIKMEIKKIKNVLSR